MRVHDGVSILYAPTERFVRRERSLAMRRFLSGTAVGISVIVFGLVCLTFSPVILFKFGVDLVRERIEAKWPNSERAKRISSWLGILAPVFLCVVMLALICVVLARFHRMKAREF